MPEPQWSKTFNGLEFKRVHRLDSYADDTQAILSPTTNARVHLPLLNPNREGPNKEYKVILSRLAHEELGRLYMIGGDMENYKRCYVVWVGIDLDRFGQIQTAKRFFNVLDMAIASEQVIIQDTTPLKGPFMPKRAFWMSMHGYFGNWYNPDDRKWAILAAKRHVRLMRKLRDRDEVWILNEEPVSQSSDYDWVNHERCGELRCRRNGFKDFDISRYMPLESNLVFPDLLEKYKAVGKEKRKSDCALM